MCNPPRPETDIMESAGSGDVGMGDPAAVVNGSSTDGSLDDFYESGEGASMLLFEFILHGIFTNLGRRKTDLAEI